MKKLMLITFLFIMGCVIVAGCTNLPFGNNEVNNSLSLKSITPIPTLASGVPETTFPIRTPPATKDVKKGLLNVSIGNYSTIIPCSVFIDNISAGTVSNGESLNLLVSEGTHVLKICNGEICVQVYVDIKHAISTSLDFGERLKIDIPQGDLSISIGGYNGFATVMIDNTSVGIVSQDKPLNLRISVGRHKIEICSGQICKNEDVLVITTMPTTIDFGEDLKKDAVSGPLTVSIGGYNAENLPVLIDNTTAGEVSQGKPLTVMMSEGQHTVKICVGIVCVNESVEIKFAQPSYVDFGERLKKDVEFSKPTVRIISYFLSGNIMSVNVEFINPEKTDHTILAKIGCGYSYVDPVSKERKNDFAQSELSKFIKAGDHQTQQIILILSKGPNVIASEPTIIEIVIK